MSKKTTTNKKAPALKTLNSTRKAQLSAALDALKTTSDESKAPVAPAAPQKIDASKAPQGGAYTLVGAVGAGADLLGGRIGARTHDIHVVFCELAQGGADVLTTRVIEQRATALSEAQGRPPCKATASHLTTMKTRDYAERVNGAWRLTSKARELVKLAPLS